MPQAAVRHSALQPPALQESPLVQQWFEQLLLQQQAAVEAAVHELHEAKQAPQFAQQARHVAQHVLHGVAWSQQVAQPATF